MRNGHKQTTGSGRDKLSKKRIGGKLQRTKVAKDLATKTMQGRKCEKQWKRRNGNGDFAT